MTWGTPTSVGTNSDFGSATVAISGVNVAAGEMIVVIADDQGTTTGNGTVADDAGNTYHLAKGISTGARAVGIYYATNVAALSSQNITYTKNASGNTSCVSGFHVSGGGAATVDINLSASGSSTTPTITSGTAAFTRELFVGAVSFQSLAGSWVNPGGWSTPPNAVVLAPDRLAGGFIVNAGTGAETFSHTFGGSTSWAIVMASFHDVASSTTGWEAQGEQCLMKPLVRAVGGTPT